MLIIIKNYGIILSLTNLINMQSNSSKTLLLIFEKIKLSWRFDDNKYIKNTLSQIMYNYIIDLKNKKLTELKFGFISLKRIVNYIKYLYKYLFLLNIYIDNNITNTK